ncbi:5-methyltetrahydropteroyltriglutamate--homocysteine S-methyltransferase [Bermanella sp. WJH001]|uniref:5-methyltetrahydropteroyltriglutamate-- homocysteine S-methyltransferase n=1 Tax=Bermanella sp. WJH001 TaxID=3048005 RepID=UPI0024BE0253|nr:5-methyltetrahydropteroyltriglutamate--homocysteine S-methyltransferase [Bermanella sp. WJH001]MDJ1536833.1 5-methyltetrahydropteroyltriglutamate--homocysteine S-methyltransferase [Bermanella sp. WJH001]
MNNINVNARHNISTHVLGYPRMGAQRQLKWALEDYWKGQLTQDQLLNEAANIRQSHWQIQLDAGLDFITAGDFALYDHVLNHSYMFGVVPERFASAESGWQWDTYFRMARGRSAQGDDCAACEMTKWFDTNYHYLVPEFTEQQTFSLNADVWLEEIKQAQALTPNVKAVLLGPLTYLWLGKTQNNGDAIDLLPQLLNVYSELLHKVSELGIEWLQLDEPILGLDLPQHWKQGFELAYNQLKSSPLKILLATYFSELDDNLTLACQLPVAGLHIDGINGKHDLPNVLDRLPPYKVLSLGLINGRNIWKADVDAILPVINDFYSTLGDRLWLASSCSLLHVPEDLDQEVNLVPQVKAQFAFAKQKCAEVSALPAQLAAQLQGDKHVLTQNPIKQTTKPLDAIGAELKQQIAQLTSSSFARANTFATRKTIQQQQFNLPLFATTTIGSFPQTKEIRQARLGFKQGSISQQVYETIMSEEIQHAVKEQENIGLDVLVHGEAERNDMVEYFGQQLEGYVFTDFGWVQSYGSRCVKPPIIASDVYRPQAMTVRWSQYAQSLTQKPMKGMLTGPITMLCWSFTREDISLKEQAFQLALALADEVLDLEKAGINMIQVDEPALREGLPLRQRDWQAYLRWAVDAFRLSVARVQDSTQIHTHMCYAEFNDIIEAIAELDADVITIETSRSNMELLQAFEDFKYPNDIGPGVYDIHSPIVPTQQWMAQLLQKAAQAIAPEQLWVNPDCGLKTRAWPETHEALTLMVKAAKQLREQYAHVNA